MEKRMHWEPAESSKSAAEPEQHPEGLQVLNEYCFQVLRGLKSQAGKSPDERREALVFK